ncbi:acyl-CoA dehydrogenase C-terminal domain-containing protein [Micromonospora sp. NPDC093277]|uniref:acyl-CoA dehydrogenase C-terminal domain-containing protein n=1 Tax=Micromonospora sp. NPDC093277 TaxID=3364291 RepID=UPI00382FB51C
MTEPAAWRPPGGRQAAGPDADFLAGKRQAARFYFRYELPRTGPQFDLLDSLDRTTLDARETWF